VKIDAPLVDADLAAIPARARAIEADGYDGAYTFEGPHDPFFPLVLAAEHSDRIDLMTAIAIAFARSPMQLAHLAWDLQQLSGGRAVVGLGSQIKPHIEKRFSMPWSAPAARMRELVQAMHAIWTAWQDGTPLRFVGEHYRHTLMTPFFSPDPSPLAYPRVFVAGVGPAMTAVAGEVADGFLVHPFSSPEFLRGNTLPALEQGFARRGGRPPGFELAWPVMVATGRSEEDRVAAELATRAQIAFYGSTPAYRPVLDAHGFGDLQPELNRLSKQGDWSAMAALVTDDVLDAIAVRGDPAAVAREIRARAEGLVDRVAPNAPYRSDPGVWIELLHALRT
jgi:probable F420-dependent oxidoreductase